MTGFMLALDASSLSIRVGNSGGGGPMQSLQQLKRIMR